MRRLLAAASAAALASCNPGFTPQYRVEDLRILAVRSQVVSTDFADGDPGTGGFPGDTLRLEALVANPRGYTPVAAAWYACVPIDPSTLPPCLDGAFLSDPARLGSAEAAARGAILLGTTESPGADGVSLDVPLSGAAADPRVAQVMEGVYTFIVDRATATPQFQCVAYVEAIVVLTVTAGGHTETAYRRVRLSPTARLAAEHPDWAGRYVRNANPTIATIVADPAATDGCTGGTALAAGTDLSPGHHVLCGTAPADAVQSYWQCGGDGVDTLRDEQLAWQWYATAGTFSDANGVGNVIEDAPGFDRPPQALTLWLVVRDGRGGESWSARTFPAP